MKKVIVFVAAAAALVACSKSEVTPALNSADTEISYLVAPKTKAAETTPTFLRTWKFKSTAYYLESSKSWANNHSNAVKYIDSVSVSWNSSESVWRNATKKYYWPKAGKLTFFAWTSLNLTQISAAMGTGTNEVVKPTETQATKYVSTSDLFSLTDGVNISDYNVTTNKNVDFLVADIKADQTANNEGAADPVYNTKGVPTLFRHKLSEVFFSLQTKDAYDYESKDGITFTVNSIKFIGIDQVGTYKQGVDATTCLGAWTNTDGVATTNDQTYYSTTSGVKVTTTTTPLVASASDQQYYYLPQDFAAQTAGSETKDYFVVNYTIKYANGTTETIEQKCILNNSTTANTIFDKWEMGKRYTINLKFSLNEILWDPAVVEWEDANKEITVQ